MKALFTLAHCGQVRPVSRSRAAYLLRAARSRGLAPVLRIPTGYAIKDCSHILTKISCRPVLQLSGNLAWENRNEQSA